MRTIAPVSVRGRNTSRARTVREPGWSTRTRSRGSRGATTTFGLTVKMRATGRTGRTRASAPPYSEPPVAEGAGVPPAYALAAGTSAPSTAPTNTIVPAHPRIPRRMPMSRTVGGVPRAAHRQPAIAQVRGPELAPPRGGARSRASGALEHPRHDLERPRLVERLVEVAALRRLHARRAARLARALADEPVRVADERVEADEPLARDPDPAGVTVVDEDRRPPGLGMEVRRQPADVPAVAHRQQRQHRDLRVLGGVQRPEHHLEREVGLEQLVGQRVPERLRGERLRRQ